MGILVVNSDFEKLWNEPYPEIAFDNATYSLAGEVGTTLSASFAIFDNYDADVTDQCEITLDNDNVSIEDGMFVCDDLEVGTYQTIATATYSYKSATVTATATINISVEEEKPTSISFDSNSYSLSGTEGETITESFTVTDNLSNDVTALCSYAFSPNDTGITASNGTFDASSVLAGTYSVTVTATYGELTTTATISMDIAASGFDNQYLTFEALESGTFTLTVPAAVDSTYVTSVSYSTDNGVNWTTTTIDNTQQVITTPTINAGDKVLWKGYAVQYGGKNASASIFNSTGKCNVSGNIMSLLYGDEFQNKTTFPIGSTYTFKGLFGSYTYDVGPFFVTLQDASNLVLPATTLAQGCYSNMFNGCTSLTTAPVLPATTLATNCYSNMFNGCTSLTTVPELPATTLAQGCCSNMFKGCTSLTTAPVLPATTLATNCYSNMFNGCTSLTTATVLPATTLVTQCYYEMFYGCTALTTAPELPATTLTSSCYYGMFKGCTSLTTAPELPATTLANDCYCQMFYGCSKLNYIKAMFTTTPSATYTNNWVTGVASTGTFVKNSAATWNVTGIHGIPSGWTVETATE